MLESLITAKLLRVGIAADVAVRDRQYGQDILCTKICGKIIECQFCVVVLNDALTNGVPVPNANVYYEYGLMTALGKHIIPLQMEGDELAFNIQGSDTIKYSEESISRELDEAIGYAARLPEVDPLVVDTSNRSDNLILRQLEMVGMTPASEDSDLARVVGDTLFRYFTRHVESPRLGAGSRDREKDRVGDMRTVKLRGEGSDGSSTVGSDGGAEGKKPGVDIRALAPRDDNGVDTAAFIARVDDARDLLRVVEDLPVIIRRVEIHVEMISERLRDADTRLKRMKDRRMFDAPRPNDSPTDLIRSEQERTIRELTPILAACETVNLGFVLSQSVDVASLKNEVSTRLKGNRRFRVVFEQDGNLDFGGFAVDLSGRA